jgi:hypothetical protein
VKLFSPIAARFTGRDRQTSAGRVARGVAAVAMAVGLAGGMALTSQGTATAAPAPAVARAAHSTPTVNHPDYHRPRPTPPQCFWGFLPGHWGWGWHWTRTWHGWGWHWTWGWNPGYRGWGCR